MPVGFTKAQVFNMAASRVGSKSTIQSETQAGVAPNACRTWYEPARFETLEAHNWSFARKSEALALSDQAAPTNRWRFRYALPSDCVAPRYIENPLGADAAPVPYELEDADDEADSVTVVTDQENAVLIYTKNHTTLDLWSMHAINMLSVRLGFYIAYELTGKSTIMDRLEKRFNDMRVQATAVDAQQEVPKTAFEAQTLKVRN